MKRKALHISLMVFDFIVFCLATSLIFLLANSKFDYNEMRHAAIYTTILFAILVTVSWHFVTTLQRLMSDKEKVALGQKGESI